MTETSDDLIQARQTAAALEDRKGGLPVRGLEALRDNGGLAIDPATPLRGCLRRCAKLHAVMGRWPKSLPATLPQRCLSCGQA